MLKSAGKNNSGSAVLEIILLIVVLLAVGTVFWTIKDRHKKTPVAVVNSSATASQAAATTVPLSSGTSDSNLNSDLANINSSNAQTSQDSNSTNSAINDQQQEITVPTN